MQRRRGRDSEPRMCTAVAVSTCHLLCWPFFQRSALFEWCCLSGFDSRCGRSACDAGCEWFFVDERSLALETFAPVLSHSRLAVGMAKAPFHMLRANTKHTTSESEEKEQLWKDKEKQSRSDSHNKDDNADGQNPASADIQNVDNHPTGSGSESVVLPPLADGRQGSFSTSNPPTSASAASSASTLATTLPSPHKKAWNTPRATERSVVTTCLCVSLSVCTSGPFLFFW